jgi:hypothetical protein
MNQTKTDPASDLAGLIIALTDETNPESLAMYLTGVVLGLSMAKRDLELTNRIVAILDREFPMPVIDNGVMNDVQDYVARWEG